MQIETILNLNKKDFEEFPLADLGLDIETDIGKINLLTQWYTTYNRPTTSHVMKQAIIDNIERLLCTQ